MDEDMARELTSLLQGCTQELARSSDEVKKLAPEPAWAPYRIIVAETMGVVYADILAEIWREHSSLEPKGDEGATYYHPELLKMPREAAEIVLRATEDAKRCLETVQDRLRGAPSSVQDRYNQVLNDVSKRLDVAARRCLRQYPDLVHHG